MNLRYQCYESMLSMLKVNNHTRKITRYADITVQRIKLSYFNCGIFKGRYTIIPSSWNRSFPVHSQYLLHQKCFSNYICFYVQLHLFLLFESNYSALWFHVNKFPNSSDVNETEDPPFLNNACGNCVTCPQLCSVCTLIQSPKYMPWHFFILTKNCLECHIIAAKPMVPSSVCSLCSPRSGNCPGTERSVNTFPLYCKLRTWIKQPIFHPLHFHPLHCLFLQHRASQEGYKNSLSNLRKKHSKI